MKFLSSLISWTMKKRIHQMQLFMTYPNEVQEELLKGLINTAKYTEFGKKFGFDSIRTSEDFRNQIPVFTYEKYFPYIDRVMKGEQQVFWPSEINWFSKSSGTTNAKSKFIPVSAECLDDCHFKCGKDMLSIYLNNCPESTFLSGKGLALGGSSYLNPYRDNSFYGDVSAVIMKNLPFWAEYLRVPDLSISLLEDWEVKVNKIIETTVKENITSMTGVPTWILVLLKKILEVNGKKEIHDIWPNLELFIHGGVSFIPYQDQFNKIINSSRMYYLETYNASEGFFALQDRKNSNDMLLMLDYGIYYEFVPAEESESENPKICSLSEVEIGKNYAIIISTNAGLWRYMIGDTIRFTSKTPFRIQVTGRTKSFINAFGEELIIENAENAMNTACEKTGAVIRDYTACPVYFGEKNKGTHEWLIEFETPPADMDFFIYLLDDSLKQQNSDYEAKRFKDMALSLPKVHALPKNTFYKWLEKKGKLGGQNKVPRLCNDRVIVDEILGMREGK